jgi:hypothetical protein
LAFSDLLSAHFGAFSRFFALPLAELALGFPGACGYTLAA